VAEPGGPGPLAGPGGGGRLVGAGPLVGWVSGAASLTDPAVARAVADALGVASGPVAELHVGEAPVMTPVAVGVSDAVRVVLGHPPPTEHLVAANVDDLDPRLWPGVLSALLSAGALDAWLTPVQMKKGRPAHTVTALTSAGALPAVRRALLTETTTIGLRSWPVTKVALARREARVAVDGAPVRVKLAELDGTVVSATPEWDDVAAAAATLGLPAVTVLARAAAEAARLLG